MLHPRRYSTRVGPLLTSHAQSFTVVARRNTESRLAIWLPMLKCSYDTLLSAYDIDQTLPNCMIIKQRLAGAKHYLLTQRELIDRGSIKAGRSLFRECRSSLRSLLVAFLECRVRSSWGAPCGIHEPDLASLDCLPLIVMTLFTSCYYCSVYSLDVSDTLHPTSSSFCVGCPRGLGGRKLLGWSALEARLS